jgi:L-alanine-DL-glutamate epimerase-like enolase superfamily enzyme
MVFPLSTAIAVNNPGSDILITKVEIYKMDLDLVKPYTIALGTIKNSEQVFIKIYTNKDIYGVGEASPVMVVQGETQETAVTMAKLFAKVLINKNPLEIARRLQEINAVSPWHNSIKSAFDMALYDIASKNAGMPLYQFLGGSNDKKIKSFGTVFIDTPEYMADTALILVKKGLEIIKVKLGKNVPADIERIRAIREKIGGDTPIFIDANQGYNEAEALKVLRAIEKYNVQSAEQPLPKDNIEGMARLNAISPIPIMADESLFDHRDALRVVRYNACSTINIKLAKSGGIHNALKIHSIAEAADIKCQVGCMNETRLGLTALAHFALACKMVIYYDIDSNLLFKDDPITGGFTLNEDLSLKMPDAIGIGADIDEKFLKTAEKYTVN